MNILITGSEGSLMQYVIPLLIKNGHNVVGIDKNSISRNRNYTFHLVDCRDYDTLRSIFFSEHFHYVIHAAASVYGIEGFHKYGADIISDDIIALINTIRCSINVVTIDKFIFISSSMVYEQVPNTEGNINEYPAPRTYYGLSKFVNEKICRAYREEYGLPYIIWRPFNIITPHERAKEEQGFSHVFADMIQQIVIDRKNVIKIIGDGEQIRCFTWIEEVAKAIVDLSFGSEQGEFNLGNIEPISMLSLARLIHLCAKDLHLIPMSQDLRFVHSKAPIDDVRKRIPDMRMTEQIFNWKAKFSTKDSVMRCLKEMSL